MISTAVPHVGAPRPKNQDGVAVVRERPEDSAAGFIGQRCLLHARSDSSQSVLSLVVLGKVDASSVAGGSAVISGAGGSNGVQLRLHGNSEGRIDKGGAVLGHDKRGEQQDKRTATGTNKFCYRIEKDRQR